MIGYITTTSHRGEPISIPVESCGICYALIVTDDLYGHSEWHSELLLLDGR